MGPRRINSQPFPVPLSIPASTNSGFPSDSTRGQRGIEEVTDQEKEGTHKGTFLIQTKMVRAPCCEKMGLKKGPWTPEEDQILVTYIQRYGHGNWRALPKQAGLLRCGKSCRLRWTNYLRPDIKRGNFSREEEETIINLHELLGNRWSAIAARLPGRTDNEIKNVWHTHLKKRLKQIPAAASEAKAPRRTEIGVEFCEVRRETSADFPTTHRSSDNSRDQYYGAVSPQQSFSDASFSGTDSASTVTAENSCSVLAENIAAELDESLWSEALSAGEDKTQAPSTSSELPEYDHQFPAYSAGSLQVQGPSYEHDLYSDENMDFWYNLLVQSSELMELPEF
ncbi:hypothetical protein H6P81_011775 [Aristolochia fimbriata]|uniref:Uncharacterized protein n=1 Tax=Aristolochia fimbriata TaxID=158543 RepID=A0AAV7EDQ7_ARIFI|nr:hypothetical protein H6P81_011775 [Aristolochia fimbriata]